MMWPAPGEGFEPSTFSPAGRAVVGWRFLRSLAWGGRRRRPWLRLATRLVLIGFLALLALGYGLSAVGR
jgi:hypothetical protein